MCSFKIVLLLLALGTNLGLAQESESQETAPENQVESHEDNSNADLTVDALIAPVPDVLEGKSKIELSLERSLEIALRNNYDRRIQAIDREVALRNIIIEKAVFDPYFNLSYTFNKNRDATASSLNLDPLNPVLGVEVNPFNLNTYSAGIAGQTILGTDYSLTFEGSRADNPEASFFSLNPRYSSRIRAQITQPILKNGWYRFNSANLRLARNNSEISREQYQQVIMNTLYDVTLAYWEVVFAHKNYESKKNALSTAQKRLADEGEKLKVGTRAPLDLIPDKSQVARRKTELDTAWNALETARDDLLNKMNFSGKNTLRKAWEKDGTNLYDSLVIVPTSEPDSQRSSPIRDQALDKAFRLRPDFKQAEFEIDNEKINVDKAKNQLLPSLDFTGSWSQIGLDQNIHDSWDGIEDGRFYNWSAGINFSIPLHYRGLIAQYDNAKGLLERSIESKNRLENTIVVEVDQAIRELQHAHRAVVNQNQLVRLQLALLEGEIKKLEVGTSINYNVVQIENDLIDIQASELRAQADYENAKAKYKMAIGELLNEVEFEVE